MKCIKSCSPAASLGINCGFESVKVFVTDGPGLGESPHGVRGGQRSGPQPQCVCTEQLDRIMETDCIYISYIYIHTHVCVCVCIGICVYVLYTYKINVIIM